MSFENKSEAEATTVMMLTSQAHILPRYHLRVVQQPLQARQVHGPGGNAVKSSELIDPPVVIELHDLSQRDPRLTLNNDFLRLVASLEFQKTDDHGRPVDQPQPCGSSSLRGERISTPQPLRFQHESANAGIMGVYTPFCKDKGHRDAAAFVFSELQCHVTEIRGRFRLKFDLFDMDYQANGMPALGREVGMVHRGFVHSDWFTVYRPEDYPGRRESTDLVGWLSKQGIGVQKHRPSKCQRNRGANVRFAQQMRHGEQSLAGPSRVAALGAPRPTNSQLADAYHPGSGIVSAAHLTDNGAGYANNAKRRRVDASGGRLLGPAMASDTEMLGNGSLAPSWSLVGAPAAVARISAPNLLASPAPTSGYVAPALSGLLGTYIPTPSGLTLPSNPQSDLGHVSKDLYGQSSPFSVPANIFAVPQLSTLRPSGLAPTPPGLTVPEPTSTSSGSGHFPNFWIEGSAVRQLATPGGPASLWKSSSRLQLSSNHVPSDTSESHDVPRQLLTLDQYNVDVTSRKTDGIEERTQGDADWMDGSDSMFLFDFSP